MRRLKFARRHEQHLSKKHAENGHAFSAQLKILLVRAFWISILCAEQRPRPHLKNGSRMRKNGATSNIFACLNAESNDL